MLNADTDTAGVSYSFLNLKITLNVEVVFYDGMAWIYAEPLQNIKARVVYYVTLLLLPIRLLAVAIQNTGPPLRTEQCPFDCTYGSQL
jgi:hypothetical protein